MLLAKRSRLPLPPGPPADPIIGHARFLPSESSWLYFTQLQKKYGDCPPINSRVVVLRLRLICGGIKFIGEIGDIVRLTAFGKPIIVLNSVKAASDLLGKRANIYADRPHFPMANDM